MYDSCFLRRHENPRFDARSMNSEHLIDAGGVTPRVELRRKRTHVQEKGIGACREEQSTRVPRLSIVILEIFLSALRNGTLFATHPITHALPAIVARRSPRTFSSYMSKTTQRMAPNRERRTEGPRRRSGTRGGNPHNGAQGSSGAATALRAEQFAFHDFLDPPSKSIHGNHRVDAPRFLMTTRTYSWTDVPRTVHSRGTSRDRQPVLRKLSTSAVRS